MIDLAGALRPRTLIPIHYEGWKHFREGREAIEQQLAECPGRRARDACAGSEIGVPEQVAV